MIHVQDAGQATDHVVVTEPCMLRLDDTSYHGDPVPVGSLSASGAKVLLDCPAKYRYQLTHPKPPTKAMRRGTAAHTVVLGAGPELVVVDGNRNAHEVQRAIAEVESNGGLALKPAEYELVHAMAAALRDDPVAAALLDPLAGEPEVAFFFVDEPTGIWRRAKLDWLPDGPDRSGAMRLFDYKALAAADKWSVRKAANRYGWHISAAQYIEAVTALHWSGDIDYVIVAQEVEPPYVVNVVQLDVEAIDVGRQRMRQALERLRDCRESGVWPGYSTEIELISLPAWATHLED